MNAQHGLEHVLAYLHSQNSRVLRSGLKLVRPLLHRYLHEYTQLKKWGTPNLFQAEVIFQQILFYNFESRARSSYNRIVKLSSGMYDILARTF